MELNQFIQSKHVTPPDTPKVSIIIPTYNRAHLVGDAIHSALAQTYPYCEVIVVDDGSTDATRSAVARFGNSVRYLHKANGGVESAMNAGAATASGEFICFLGDDDLLKANAVAEELALMQSDSRLGVVFGRSEIVDENGNVTDTIQPPYDRRPGMLPGTEELKHLSFTNYITGAATLVRKAAFNAAGGFNPACHGMCEDWDLWVRIACRWSIGFVPSTVQTIRVTPGHLLSQIRGSKMYGLLENHRRIVDTVLADPDAAPALAAHRDRIQACWLVSSASVAYAIGSIQEARNTLAQAKQLYPRVFEDPEIAGAGMLRNRLRLPSTVIRLARAMRGRRIAV